jgi:hypothetical protein
MVDNSDIQWCKVINMAPDVNTAVYVIRCMNEYVWNRENDPFKHKTSGNKVLPKALWYPQILYILTTLEGLNNFSGTKMKT